MGDPATQLLQHVLRSHGVATAGDARRLQALLKDYARGQYKREIHLWTLAAQEGIAAALLDNRRLPLPVVAARLGKLLHEDYAVDPQAAAWAVQSWAEALGLSAATGNGVGVAANGQGSQLAGNATASSPPFIHGWPAAKVQAMQRAAAVAMGLPVLFRHPMREGEPGPEMVVVPAGAFLMGSPDAEPGHLQHESPQHRVVFAKPFAVGRYAVTFDEYDRFCTASKRDRPGDGGWGRGKRPVVNVSWYDAQEYCAWLAAQTGQGYRLPNEAEWEYACRAGSTTAFWWGDAINTGQANYGGHWPYGGGASGEFREQTVPADAFLPNPWGLYQMHGNVWEWCADHWHGDYSGAPDDGSLWADGDTDFRVLRGGSWISHPGRLRSARRNRGGAVYRVGSRGFRVAQG